jgi:predicted ABC-type transport system involved in lysophospholipase L1 biosynthesis ATPase subunit
MPLPEIIDYNIIKLIGIFKASSTLIIILAEVSIQISQCKSIAIVNATLVAMSVMMITFVITLFLIAVVQVKLFAVDTNVIASDANATYRTGCIGITLLAHHIL